jgi:hypothetical protein
MTICYVFASRSRPSKFYECLDAVKKLSASDNYFVVAKLDNDDEFIEEYKARLAAYPEVSVKWGLSKGKIHAINRDLEDLPPCDIIIVLSDDMIAEYKGFDDEIRQTFKDKFPDCDGIVHTNDGHCREHTMTLTIIGYNLFKQLGYLYYPEYFSIFSDNDLTEMCKLMGKHVYVNKVYFRHFHPIWRMAVWDEQYKRTESRENYRKDGDIFKQRKAINFGL